MKRAAFPALAALALGCASPRPKLYPNARLEQVGPQAADADIDECLSKAKQYVKANRLKPAGESTAWGAAAGAAIGAVTGLIQGDLTKAVTSGAAAGGAGGAVHGAYQSTKPDELEREFTDRCLREKGYSVLGWR